MAHRILLAAGLLLGGLGLAPSALAEWSRYSSKISEVDACNQAHYLLPSQAVVKSYGLQNRETAEGLKFDCSIHWTLNPNQQPTGKPILLPNEIRQPIFWFAAGWL
jgi:hypothetical protein